MSTVDDLYESITRLADDTEAEAGTLTTAKTQLEDQAEALSGELESSQTGDDVRSSFTAAVTAIEDAVGKLEEAVEKARDYAEALRSN